MNRERLPAITVMQPSATMIVAGLQRVEFRMWAAPKRFRNCRLALHSSARQLPKRDLLSMREEVRGTSTEPFIEAALRKQLPLGAVLGVVKIIRVVKGELEESTKPGLMKILMLGGFSWEIEVIEVFKNPVPARGSLGFWKWEYNPAGRRAVQGALL